MDMRNMLCQGMAVNHNIVKVYDEEFSFHWLQDAVPHAHERAGCVHQAKRQDSPLIQAKFSGKGCLLPVGS